MLTRISRRPFRFLLVSTLGAVAACSGAPKPGSNARVAGEGLCAQAPLEEALAYDSGSKWWNVAVHCGCDPGQLCMNPQLPEKITSCLQAQLDAFRLAAVNGPVDSPVVYFPNGSYTINNTLTLTGVPGAVLMGQDPEQTTIAWGGPPAQPDPDPKGNGVPPCNGALTDGQDPACDVGNMLHIDGSLNIKVTRLAFDGRIAGSAATAKAAIRVALYQGYADNVPDPQPGDPGHLKKVYKDGKTRYASTANEFSDLFLHDAWYGIRAAIPGGANDAENTVRRVRFKKLSVAGFSAESQNCMNNNIWDSRFEECDIAARAIPGSLGIYNSTFEASAQADIVNGVSTGFNFVIQGNTSVKSSTFFRAGASLARIVIQDNRISVTDSTAIDVLTPQSALILDNVIYTTPAAPGSGRLPIVVTQAAKLEYPQSVNHIITGNIFSTPEASTICAFQAPSNSKFGDIQDCVPSLIEDAVHANIDDGGYFYGNTFGVKSEVKAPLPVATPVAKPLIASNVPGASSRVAPCNGAQGCFDSVNIANALQFLSNHCGERPILHLLSGTYFINGTIVLPNGPAGGAATGCPIQIFGDGAFSGGTMLLWNVDSQAQGAEGYMFEMPSPAKAVIQDLYILSKANNNPQLSPPSGRGILIHVPSNTSNGLVYLNQVKIRAADSAQRQLPPQPQPEDNVGFISSGVDHLDIESEQSSFGGGDVAIRVVGGGAGAQGMANVSAAKFRNLPISAIFKSQFDVQNHGNLYVSDLEAEGYTHGIRLDGPRAAGRLTVTTGNVFGSVSNRWPTSPPDAGKIVVGAFSGEVNLHGLATNMPVRVTAAADPLAYVRGFGLYYSNRWTWVFSSPDALWVNDAIHGQWNSDGPPSPSPAQPKAYPELKPIPFHCPPTYIDCAGYAAWNVNIGGSLLINYKDFPSTKQYFPKAKGVFYAEGATSAGHTFLLNNLMVNRDFGEQPYWQAQFHTASRCQDVKPPLASSAVVSVIDAGLAEIRKAKTAIPHPCGAATDVRVFRVTYAALASRTGFAILGPEPYCTKDTDCVQVPDYDTCQCLGVRVGTPPPKSSATCAVDPCAGHHAACNSATGACTSATSSDQ